MKRIMEIWQYREMLKNLVKKDLRTRYKGSFLGFFWTFLNPLLMLIVFTLVFSAVMRIKMDNYSIFLFVGLLPWNFFQNSLIVGTKTIIENGNLVKKVYFPTEVLPLAVTLGGLVNYLLSLTILLPALWYFHVQLTSAALLFPLVLFLQCVFTLGLVLLVSSVNVYFRDLEHILTVFMTAWFYITPIVYPYEMVPVAYKWILSLNPLSTIILAYQKMFFFGEFPELKLLLNISIVSIVMLILGYSTFNLLKKRFAEEI